MDIGDSAHDEISALTLSPLTLTESTLEDGKPNKGRIVKEQVEGSKDVVQQNLIVTTNIHEELGLEPEIATLNGDLSLVNACVAFYMDSNSGTETRCKKSEVKTKKLGNFSVVNQVDFVLGYGLEVVNWADPVEIIGTIEMMEGFIWDSGPIVNWLNRTWHLTKHYAYYVKPWLSTSRAKILTPHGKDPGEYVKSCFLNGKGPSTRGMANQLLAELGVLVSYWKIYTSMGIAKDLVRGTHEHGYNIMTSNIDESVNLLFGDERVLRSTKVDKVFTGSEAELADMLQKSLKGKRYIIVLDDMCKTEAWDAMRQCFPCENKGSGILLTTRNTKVARDVRRENLSLQIDLMCLDESSNLFKSVAFANEALPCEFETNGKKITKKCHRLPLTIAVVVGVLRSKRVIEDWENVAKDVKSFVTNDPDVHVFLG
ncbi:hypothetical protein T459_24249 [Capsicum annuum]|uniref:NB-ARC domain-containing protein n=1 Tax=Capsicum annuum TaxID=4072 RepID=A0A2G2YUT9_CAPAN|nr:hypothetical protein T459_24249 [Capsicum annuum]